MKSTAETESIKVYVPNEIEEKSNTINVNPVTEQKNQSKSFKRNQ